VHWLRTYTPDDGRQVLPPVRENPLPMLEDFLTPPTGNRLGRAQVRIDVADGSWYGIGLEQVAADRLAWEGFAARPLEGVTDVQVEQTVIYDYTGQIKGSPLPFLQQILRVDDDHIIRLPDPNRTVDFRVEIGTAYNACVYTTAEDEPPADDDGESLSDLPSAACWLGFKAGVNVRTGPGLDQSVLDMALPDDHFPVLGQNADRTWWQVDNDGEIGGYRLRQQRSPVWRLWRRAGGRAARNLPFPLCIIISLNRRTSGQREIFMPQLFISYSRTDGVCQLDGQLAAGGADIWIDMEGIRSGEDWSNAIQQALDMSEVMILVITPESMDSVNVASEWKYYLDEGKTVIPVMLREARINFRLKPLNYVDFSKPDYDAAFTRLKAELETKGLAFVPPDKRADKPRAATPESDEGMSFRNLALVVAIAVLALAAIILSASTLIDLDGDAANPPRRARDYRRQMQRVSR
jgi:hypothetical protein